MSARTDSEATQNQLSSGITADSLAATIRDRLDAAHVDIHDLSGEFFEQSPYPPGSCFAGVCVLVTKTTTD